MFSIFETLFIVILIIAYVIIDIKIYYQLKDLQYDVLIINKSIAKLGEKWEK